MFAHILGMEYTFLNEAVVAATNGGATSRNLVN